MASSRTEALILRSVDFGESDRILHLLVPESGRLTAIAKGARRSVRRFGGTLDLFNHLSVQVWKSGKASMARLEQAQLIEAFGSLRADSARFALGCYLLELLDRLAPEGGAPADMARLFRFALASLGSVAARPPRGARRIASGLGSSDQPRRRAPSPTWRLARESGCAAWGYGPRAGLKGLRAGPATSSRRSTRS